MEKGMHFTYMLGSDSHFVRSLFAEGNSAGKRRYENSVQFAWLCLYTAPVFRRATRATFFFFFGFARLREKER